MDGLGRLESVTESGSLVTSYTYDPLSDLLNVNQSGRQRNFGYSSLGRLLSAANPETEMAATSYSYDDNGNLVTRSDPRGTVLCFGVLSGSSCGSSGFQGYNHRNQPIRKQYSDATPAVTLGYGGCGNGAGRLCSVTNSVSATNYDYDPLGRVSNNIQTTGGVAYPLSYVYQPNDALAQMTYPSGRTISYGFNAGGRVQSVSGVLGSTATNYTDPAHLVAYAAHGAVSTLSFYQGIGETWSFNARLQPTELVAAPKRGTALR